MAAAAETREVVGLRGSDRPAPTLDGLQTLYAAWCRKVPFDNVRKLIHFHSHASGPLPGPVNFRGVRLGVPVCEDIPAVYPYDAIPVAIGEQKPIPAACRLIDRIPVAVSFLGNGWRDCTCEKK